MKATRRNVLAGALGVPIIAGPMAGFAHARGAAGVSGGASVLLHDPTLAAARRFAEAGRMAGGAVMALEGDPIRLAQSLLEERPARIAGISRHADALLIEEAAAERGYHCVVALEGRGAACSLTHCRAGWQMLGDRLETAGRGWAEALAFYAAGPGRGGDTLAAAPGRAGAERAFGREHVFGWLLARV